MGGSRIFGIDIIKLFLEKYNRTGENDLNLYEKKDQRSRAY